MPNFNKYSNYNENTGFTSVVFGAESPLLEVELNEMQQIFNNKFGKFIKSFGKAVFNLGEDKGGLDLFQQWFTLKNSVVLCNGVYLFVKESGVFISNLDYSPVYVRIEKEIDVTKDTKLTAYGDTIGNSVTNPIQDTRLSTETTRRKLIKFSFVVIEGEAPVDDEQYSYVLVAEIRGGDVMWNTCRPVTSLDLANFRPSSPLALVRSEDILKVVSTSSKCPIKSITYLSESGVASTSLTSSSEAGMATKATYLGESQVRIEYATFNLNSSLVYKDKNIVDYTWDNIPIYSSSGYFHYKYTLPNPYTLSNGTEVDHIDLCVYSTKITLEDFKNLIYYSSVEFVL